MSKHTYTEHLRQVYAGGDVVFSVGYVEGHPVDTLYLRLARAGEEPTTWLLTRDEMASIAWLASGILWSELYHEAHGETETPAAAELQPAQHRHIIQSDDSNNAEN